MEAGPKQQADKSGTDPYRINERKSFHPFMLRQAGPCRSIFFEMRADYASD